jgi:hypothetical protein
MIKIVVEGKTVEKYSAGWYLSSLYHPNRDI